MKDKNNGTGEGRTTCPFYDELDAILGHRAASSPPVVLDTGSLPEGESLVERDQNGILIINNCLLKFLYNRKLNHD